MTLTIRQMTDDDIVAASHAQVAAFEELDRRLGLEVHSVVDDAQWERVYDRHRHFRSHDPDGAWVAVDDGKVIGSALALKREALWGLSLLVVDPTAQSTGAGRKLLDASLTYAQGCDRGVIMSSSDPRAIRAYATSGFALYPQVEARGVPERTSLRTTNRVRDGSSADIKLADDIDRLVRGAPHGPDHERMLMLKNTMFVIDDVDGRGYAYIRNDGEVYLLAATDDATATELLWRGFAHAVELDKPINAPNLDAKQQWAIEAAFATRLKVTPGGPVFWRGIAPPASYLASGAFL